MSTRATSLAVVILLVCGVSQTPLAQKPPDKQAEKQKKTLLKMAQPWPEPAVLQARRDEAQKLPLFAESDPLAFSLTADFKAIDKDRNPESTAKYPGVLATTDARGREQTLHVQLSPRGHFRRNARTCAFVPLRIEFDKKEVAGTVFDGQSTLKLGVHCQNEKAYDQFVLREYLTYKLFNLVTPQSFRDRLAQATYVDAKSGKPMTTHYAIFIEEDNDVARRMGGRIVELPRLQFADVDAGTLRTAALFEYMIGNTDYSLYALHNVKVVQDPTKTLFAVPYDFDLSGFVNPPYALVDRRLGITSVKDRLYRGPCGSADEFEAIAAKFRDKKADMLALVEGMKDLDGSTKSESKDYLEAFFRGIAQPTSVKKSLADGCKAKPTM
ncbi:MAG TPA: hypothetical protein VL309_03275 [Vicinamibacterales bacterium]|nr:hypothetical protein [Vicinamibacterales bacterium]